MPQFTKQNFISTLADLSVNLSAGWLGVLLIFPTSWMSNDWGNNLTIIITNLFNGLLSFFISVYLRKVDYGT